MFHSLLEAFKMKGINITKFNLIFLALAVLLLMPLVSAWEWDNIKQYDAGTKTVTIVNALGLGSDLATIQMVNYIGYCFAGDCWAYYSLDNKAENIALKYSKTYNKEKTIELTGKQNKYEIWDADASYDVPIYKEVCNIVENKS